MSWDITIGPHAFDVVEDAIEEAQLGDTMQSPEHEQQLAAAKTAAIALLRAGSIGQPPYVAVYLFGHSNERHSQRAKWADPQVNVTVRAMFEPPVAHA